MLHSIDKLSIISESRKGFKCHVQRDQVSFGLRILVIAISDVNSLRPLLLRTHNCPPFVSKESPEFRAGRRSLTEYEIVLPLLTVADLPLHRVAALVRVHIELRLVKHTLHLIHIAICGRHDRNDKDLAGTQPERPFPGKMLRQDGHEALEAADDCPMYHHRASPPRTRFLR